jgi:hypothetical protein
MSFYPRYKTLADDGGAFFVAWSGNLLVGVASATLPQSVYGGFQVCVDGFTHYNYMDVAWLPLMRKTLDWASKTMGANIVTCNVATVDTEKKELLRTHFNFLPDKSVQLDKLVPMDDYASCPAQPMEQLRLELPQEGEL